MDTGQVFFCTALLKSAEGCNSLSGWPPCRSVCSDFHVHGTEGSHKRQYKYKRNCVRNSKVHVGSIQQAYINH